MQNYHESPESVEARAIMRLVCLGTTTLENARELIGIPQRQQDALNAFVVCGGKAGQTIGYALNFRRAVLKEFEKLVALAGLDAPSSMV